MQSLRAAHVEWKHVLMLQACRSIEGFFFNICCLLKLGNAFTLWSNFSCRETFYLDLRYLSCNLGLVARSIVSTYNIG